MSEPALSAEEWAERLRRPGRMVGGERLVGAVELVHTSGTGNRLEMVSNGHGQFSDVYTVVENQRHAVAAECLHGQPFGFSRDLCTRLRHAPSLQGYDDDHFVISREDLKILLQARTEAADRIEALLPPEEV